MPETTKLTPQERNFPNQLRELPGCPSAIFVRGSIEVLQHRPSIAVVGTRRLTRYGEIAIRMLVPTWSRHGLSLISGLALGVDALAHQTALESNGLTVGILGSGVDRQSVTPRSNSSLAERIVLTGGALVSEYPDGTAARPHHFPARNRIIAGLSLAVVVIEAPFKSGAMITARHALDYGLEVFAVPGPIDVETSCGTNWLIAQGAHPLLRPEDLLERMGIPKLKDESSGQLELPGLSGAVLKQLQKGPATIDTLADHLTTSAPEIMAALSELEIDGAVGRTGGKYVKN